MIIVLERLKCRSAPKKGFYLWNMPNISFKKMHLSNEYLLFLT